MVNLKDLKSQNSPNPHTYYPDIIKFKGKLKYSLSPKGKMFNSQNPNTPGAD